MAVHVQLSSSIFSPNWAVTAVSASASGTAGERGDAGGGAIGSGALSAAATGGEAMGSDACLRTPSHENAVALADLVTEHAVGDHGFLGHFAGRAALVDAFENVLPGGTVWSAHYMVNPVLHVSGSEAGGTWDFLIHAVPRGAPAGATVTFYGRYEETYSKTTTGWKIASLKVHFASPPQ